MILVTEAGYHGIVALSACSTRPVSASTTSHASARTALGSVRAIAATAINFSGETPSNARMNCTIRVPVLQNPPRLLEEVLECEIQASSLSGAVACGFGQTIPACRLRTEACVGNSWTKWAEFRQRQPETLVSSGLGFSFEASL